MAPARRADVAAAGEDEEVTLRVLGHADGFADRVAGYGQPQHFLGDLELRCVLLERLLARESGLLFGARSLRCGGRGRLSLSTTTLCIDGDDAEQQRDQFR